MLSRRVSKSSFVHGLEVRCTSLLTTLLLPTLLLPTLLPRGTETRTGRPSRDSYLVVTGSCSVRVCPFLGPKCPVGGTLHHPTRDPLAVRSSMDVHKFLRLNGSHTPSHGTPRPSFDRLLYRHSNTSRVFRYDSPFTRVSGNLFPRNPSKFTLTVWR